jgi:hypothetical protein
VPVAGGDDDVVVLLGLWAANDVRRAAAGATSLRHPTVGDLDLHHRKFVVLGASGQMLVTYHADPGSVTELRLRELAGLDLGPAVAMDGTGARRDGT